MDNFCELVGIAAAFGCNVEWRTEYRDVQTVLLTHPLREEETMSVGFGRTHYASTPRIGVTPVQALREAQVVEVFDSTNDICQGYQTVSDVELHLMRWLKS